MDTDEIFEEWCISAEANGDVKAWVLIKYSLTEEEQKALKERLKRIGVIVF